MAKRKIYGVSSKYNFGWSHEVYCFSDMEIAEAWLNRETYRFAERELMTKTEAIKLAGRKAVENAKTIKSKEDLYYDI